MKRIIGGSRFTFSRFSFLIRYGKKKNMDSNLRWVAVAFVLGLCAAYALWGGAPAVAPKSEEPTPRQAPTITGTTPATSTATDPKVVLPFKFDPPAVNFGDVMVGETKTEVVSLTNMTDKPVKVTECKHSCGCMKSEIMVGDIAPGKSGSIKLTFTGLPGKRPEKYTVEPLTEEPLLPCLFEVTAKVVQVYEVENELVNLERLAKGESRSFTTTVKRVDGSPFNLVAWAFDKLERKEFKVVWNEIEGSKKSAYRVTVTATGIKGTRVKDKINLVTDRPPVTSIPLFVTLDVDGDVKCSDQRLVFSLDEQKAVKPAATTLKRSTPGTLEVEKIEDSEGGTVTFESQAVDASTVKLTIQVSLECKTHQPWGELLVKTNTPDDPLHIPYAVPRTHTMPKVLPQKP
jgi:hypothetical protein